MLRVISPNDIIRLQQIHDKFYKHEFEFPDFLHGFISAFTVLDDSTGEIIASGGVRNIAETIVITNKDLSVKTRRNALYSTLDASTYIAGHVGFDQLHAFIQDDMWKKHLIKVGFKPTKGQALVINL